MAKADLTAQRLRELLHYDPETGVFTRRAALCNSVKVGAVAGCNDGSGYVRLSIDGHRHRAHRVAWLYVIGSPPDGIIDHINGDKSDNRFANLRVVTMIVNKQNMRRARADSGSGLIGAHKIKNRWHAKITLNGRRLYLGSFKTPELAHAAYIKAKRELHEGCTI